MRNRFLHHSIVCGFAFAMVACTGCPPNSNPDDSSRLNYQNTQEANTLVDKGGFAYLNGDIDEAIAYYREAIELDPNCHMAYIGIGNCQQFKGENEQAVESYTKVIQLEPEFENAYLNRALVFFALGQFDRCIEDYKSAIRINRKFVPGHQGLAAIYSSCREEEFRDGELAVKYGLRACKLTNYQDDDQFENLAAAYAQNGEFKKAVETIDKAMELSPNERLEERNKMRELFLDEKPSIGFE